jgi:hypothetical protein
LTQWSDDDERRSALLVRLDQLILDHARDWVRPFARLLRDLAYIGHYLGHVGHLRHGDGCLTISMSVEQFLAERQRLFFPSFLSDYIRVGLSDDNCLDRKLLPTLTQTRELDRVTEVEFVGYLSYGVYPSIDGADLKALFESPHWRRLHRLELSFNELDDPSAFALARVSQLPRVEFLDLSHNHLTATAASELLTSACLPRLKRLCFAGNDLTVSEQRGLTARFGYRVWFKEADES